MAGQSVGGAVAFGWVLSLLLMVNSVAAQAVVEGKVDLPSAKQLISRARYIGQPVQPGPPEPPTAVVYLDGAPAPAAMPAPGRVVMAQTNLQFSAGLLPVRVGTEVVFPNQDEVYHNVFSYSKVKRFDLGRYRRDESPPAQVFDRPGVVKLYCEIHEHMRARILVLETPYFVKTDTNGVFKLENLPPGNFQVKAWVDESDIRSQPVELRPNATNHVLFPLRK